MKTRMTVLRVGNRTIDPDGTSTHGAQPLRVHRGSPTTEELMYTVESSGVLEFWGRPEEDVYGELPEA